MKKETGPYKVLIIEDDLLIAESLKDILECLGHEVIAIADGGEEALLVLKKDRPDIVLIDIQLKGKMDGIDLSSIVREKYETPFIFTTALADEETIRRAKQEGPYGYLVKPYGMKDINAAIEVAMNNFQLIRELKSYKNQPATAQNDHLYIKVDSRLVKLNENDIFYIEASGDYAVFKTREKGYVVYSTLKNVEEKLDPARFLRVHRSYIINISKIGDIAESTVVINKKVIPVSRSNREALMKRIKIV